MSDFSERINNLAPNKRWLLALKELEAKLSASERAKKEPIAIVGIGCRFPGGTHDPEGYWNFLRAGGDAVEDVPASRWNIDDFYASDPTIPGKMTTRRGAFIDNVEQFDASFFGIAPREAVSMDPQQRLLLEVTWEALEHANMAPGSLSGSRTGTFIGISSSDYAHLQTALGVPQDAYTGTGQAFCVAAGRLSYAFGFQGPSIAIDTACSSSLVAVHLACQSLRSAECNLAIAGGVNLLLGPDSFIYYSNLHALASDGHCKTFDAAADGYGRGEGAGVVVLKRLSDALADGDTIFALIRGSAVNQDGRSNGLTAPNGLAQQAVIRQALAQAEIEPSAVGYVETHGTGTKLGDPVEVQSLGSVYCQGVKRERPLVLGAVKTNIGHLEAASGIAGLIKVIQVLRYGAFAPLMHLQQRNPYISWDELSIDLPTTYTPWLQDDGLRTAGLSAFGFSGTNAHLILQEPPARSTTHNLQENVKALEHNSAYTEPYFLLPLSARDPDALRSLSSSYIRFLAQASENEIPLSDICFTASTRRDHNEQRLAVSGQNHAELIAGLRAFTTQTAQLATASIHSGVITPGQRPKSVFVFAGQGGQWPGMGRQLLETEVVFQQAIEECEQAMRPYIDWSLRERLQAYENSTQMGDIALVQPLIFAIQIGLARLWRSWGIEPDAVVGHSMGEVAAAQVAGILSLEDAACIICQRSKLLRRLSGQGRMVSVELSLAELQQAIEQYSAHVAIAVSNGPRSTVLAGDSEILLQLVDEFEQRNIFCRWIRVDVASHSPQVDVLRDDLDHVMRDIQPRTGNIPFYSTVTRQVHTTLEAGPDYWIQNLRQPVRFWDVVQELIAEGYTQFVELSPHPTLLHAIAESARFLQKDVTVLPSLHREQNEHATLLETLGALYAGGQEIHWANLKFSEEPQRVSLPPYPWRYERFWFEIPQIKSETRAAVPLQGVHPLLGKETIPATQQGMYLWETQLDLHTLSYLREHRVGDAIVVPAAAYVEMMHAATQSIFAHWKYLLTDLAFNKMLVLHEEQPRMIQVVLSQSHPGQAQAQIFSRASNEQTSSTTWTLHASGSVVLTPSVTSTSDEDALDIGAIQQRCQHSTDSAPLYALMRDHGVDYGPAFQCIQEYWQGAQEGLTHLLLGDDIRKEQGAYQLHPVLLDAILQSLGIVLIAEEANTTYLPTKISQFQINGLPWSEDTYDDLWAYAQLRNSTEGQIEGDVFLLRGSGEVLLKVQGLHCQILEKSSRQQYKEELSNWLYTFAWEECTDAPTALVSAATAKQQPGYWLIFADIHGQGEHIAHLLMERGEHCIVIQQGEEYQCQDKAHYLLNPARPESFLQLLKEIAAISSSSYRGIVYLWSLDVEAIDELAHCDEQNVQEAQSSSPIKILHLIQALVQMGWRNMPRLWLVTSGVQRIHATDSVSGLAQSSIWGLGRVISHEHANLVCSCVDLSQKPEEREVDALFQEIWHDGAENQIVLRNQQRYVARLSHYTSSMGTDDSIHNKQALVLAEKKPYRLEVDQVGILDTAVLRETQLREPGTDEVEIQVYAAGLNFLDVLAAMGIRPDMQDGAEVPFGIECAGVVTRVGSTVRDRQIGDEVVAIASGSLGAYAVTPAQFAVTKPEHLTFEEAAGIPIAFLTAYYALVYLGHLSKGERVLIHSAAGGVGLAAVWLAQQIGAEIFATAGSEEKRAYLRTLGIKHIMDSRSLAFADEVWTTTKGEGVHVVLNALTGEAIGKSLDILAPYGRFLEIGKKDIYQHQQINLWPFHKNLSYFAIDLARMLHERVDFCSRLFREVMASFTTGDLQPLPSRNFSINNTAEAFQYMAQARHIGKIVLTLHGQKVWIEPLRKKQSSSGIQTAATYLITGGLGSLGLLVAQWLAQHGAQHLMLVSRHAPEKDTQIIIQQIEAQGTEVRVVLADISKREQVEHILNTITKTMPPLVGVFHAAGLLDDAILLRQNEERFKKVLAPKVSGSWNLHTATKHLALQHFVLFSSAASLLGGPGQGNYAAANAYMDALAHYRQSQGLAGLSINWGPWARVGLAAEQASRDENSTFRGMQNIEPEKGIEILAFLLLQQPIDDAQVGVFSLDIRQWSQYYPRLAESPLFTRLMNETQQTREIKKQGGAMRQVLEVAEPGRRKQLLEAHLYAQIAQVLRLDPSRLDPQSVLERLGFDSLMALELRNRLELSLELTLPATLIWAHPTTTALAAYLADQMHLSLREDNEDAVQEQVASNDAEKENTFSSFLSTITNLTDNDLDAAISDEINKHSEIELLDTWLEKIGDSE